MAEQGQPQQSSDETKRIALWAVLRLVSTAFERIFVERDDAEVLHEPFSHVLLPRPGAPQRSPVAEDAYGAMCDRVLATDGAPIVFLKDMAYHAAPMDDATFYAAFANTFLIRQPREALASLHRIWPDFSPEEAGYRDQARLFDLVTQKLEQPGIVVDATDFRREPEHMMRSYCDAVGIRHVEEAMSWRSREVGIWRLWAEWHQGGAGEHHDQPAPRKAGLTSACRRAWKP